MMRRVTRHKGLLLGTAILLLVAVVALGAGLIASADPASLRVTARLRPPSERWWFGTDSVGRDVFARTVYGSRASLELGGLVAALAVSLGLALGVLTGMVRWVDAIGMRVIDGVMAIPSILIAVALVTLAGSTLATVVMAIAIPEIPRVARLVRSVVLMTRTEPYLEAATVLGTSWPLLVWRHVLPSTIPPLVVQATYVAASAILLEAVLSFVGVGLPPTVPSWGNIMADGRSYFQLAPWLIFFPGAALALLVLGLNLVGDGLRDTLDTRAVPRV